MTDMFEDVANFSRISEEKLKVSKIAQKAFLEVNEEGGEAAAVTGKLFLTITQKLQRMKIKNCILSDLRVKCKNLFFPLNTNP